MTKNKCGRCDYEWEEGENDDPYCPKCSSCGVCGCCPCNKPNCEWCNDELLEAYGQALNHIEYLLKNY